MRSRSCVLALSMVFSCSVILSSCSVHTTGDDLLKSETGLVSQSYVTMDESNITALTGGQVEKVLVSEGDTITANQELVVLNNDALQAQKDQTQAALRQAQAGYDSAVKGARPEEKLQLKTAVTIAQTNLTQAKASLDQAQTTFHSYEALHKDGIISDTDLDSKRISLVAAQASFDNAQSNLSISQAKLKQAESGATPEDLKKAKAAVDQAAASVKNVDISINKCVLKASVSGVVTTVNVKKGDLISSGLPTVVVTDTEHPYIVCNIDETDIAKVTLNQKVQVSLLAEKEKAFLGKVVRINKNADFATKKASNQNENYDILSYGVKVEFEDVNALKDILHPGMTAIVTFGK